MSRSVGSAKRFAADALVGLLAGSVAVSVAVFVLSGLLVPVMACTSADWSGRLLGCWYPFLGTAGLGAALLARWRGAAPRWVALLAALPLCVGGAAFVRPWIPSSAELRHRDELRLARAARAGDVAEIARLLDEGVAPGGVAGVAPAALDEAVEGDRLDAFALLLRAGARPRAGDLPRLLVDILDGKRRVSRRGDWVEVILASGEVDPRWMDEGGSLLHHALDDPAPLAVLLRHGADPAVPGGALGVTPLCLAASSGRWRSALVLVDGVEQDRWCLRNALEALDLERDADGGKADPIVEKFRVLVDGAGR